MFLGNREYANLPRKLNVAFTGCLENCIHAETQDIAMTPATGPGGVAGFNVAVGGKMGSGGMTVAQPLDVFVKPEDAARLAATISLLFRDEGSREKRTRARPGLPAGRLGSREVPRTAGGTLGRGPASGGPGCKARPPRRPSGREPAAAGRAVLRRAVRAPRDVPAPTI